MEPAPLRALLWPARATVLLLVALLAPPIALVIALLPSAGLICVPALYMLAALSCRYADELLGRALQGEAEPAPLSLETLQPFRPRPLLPLAVSGGALALAAWAGTAGRWAACALLGLLPLVQSLLHIESTTLAAFAPWRWLQALRALGAWYLLVLAIGAAGLALLAFAGHVGVPLVLRTGWALLLLFGLFALTGAACHARRFELGYEPVNSSERSAARAASERGHARDAFIDRLYGPVRNGKVAEARALLSERLQSLEPRWLDEEAQALLAAEQRWASPRTRPWLGAALLARQLQCGHVAGALDTATRLLHADPALAVADAQQRATLAQLADETGRTDLARRLRAGVPLS